MEHQDLADIKRTLGDLGRAVEGLAAWVDGLDGRLGHIERQASAVARISACEAWVTAEPPSDMLISVVMPTRDRSALLPRAIASVQAQTHLAWELLVVDDASTDDTAAVVAAIDDPRITLLSSNGSGEGRARNIALDAARGDAIAYLDDDNRMLPIWLAAVAWAFEHHPEHDALYGARVHENMHDSLPELQFDPLDPTEIHVRNPVDTNVLAHRRGAPHARWDEELRIALDWELMTRMSAGGALLPLPVRAALYSTSAPGRVSQRTDRGNDYIEIRRRAATGQDQRAGASPPISPG